MHQIVPSWMYYTKWRSSGSVMKYVSNAKKNTKNVEWFKLWMYVYMLELHVRACVHVCAQGEPGHSRGQRHSSDGSSRGETFPPRHIWKTAATLCQSPADHLFPAARTLLLVSSHHLTFCSAPAQIRCSQVSILQDAFKWSLRSRAVNVLIRGFSFLGTQNEYQGELSSNLWYFKDFFTLTTR